MFWDGPEDLILDGIGTAVGEVLRVLGEMPEGKQLDFEGFAEKSSDAIDRLIIEKLQQGKEFVAGRFNLVCIDDEHFKFTIEMYFRDPSQPDYIRLDGESKPINMSILKPNARDILKLEREIKYDVNAPVLPSDDSTAGDG